MSRPHQILHFVAELDGYGQTRQLELLVREQLATGQAVSIVALAASRAAVATFAALGVRCRVLDRRWRRDPFAATRLVGELRQQPYDLLHLWGQAAVDYLSAIRPVVPPRPTLTSLPEATLLNAERKGVLPGVATCSTAATSREQFCAEQLLPSDARLLTVGGPLTRAQQIDEAIWFFELVRTLDEKVRLLIFGEGPDRHRLERFSRLTSEPDTIRFLGYRSDFRELLAHMDLFWHTAKPDEALPQTVLEAMAAGVPVVASDSPGCRQIIDDQHNGYLVADKDRAAFARQSRRILYDAQQAQSLTTSATQTITERFSVEAMTQSFADHYAALLC